MNIDYANFLIALQEEKILLPDGNVLDNTGGSWTWKTDRSILYLGDWRSPELLVLENFKTKKEIQIRFYRNGPAYYVGYFKKIGKTYFEAQLYRDPKEGPCTLKFFRSGAIGVRVWSPDLYEYSARTRTEFFDESGCEVLTNLLDFDF